MRAAPALLRQSMAMERNLKIAKPAAFAAVFGACGAYAELVFEVQDGLGPDVALQVAELPYHRPQIQLARPRELYSLGNHGATALTPKGGIMMKKTKQWPAAIVAAFAGAAIALAANDDVAPSELKVYEDFARSGVFDSELSNAKANELVYRGLLSDNPRLIRLTMQALGSHAMQRALQAPVVERHFAAVPQLKEVLIARWHEAVVEESYALVLGDVAELVEATKGLAGNELMAAMSEFAPDWITIPRVLAANFPGDEDVYALMLEFLAVHPAAQEHAGWSLMFLNQGRFKTPEADRLRIEGLEADHFTFVNAVEGLAMSKPEGGLEALISTLRDNGRPERDQLLVDAIVSYGPEAAIPMLGEELLGRIRRSSPVPW